MLVNRLIHESTSKEVRILFLYLFVNSKGGPSRLKIVSLLRRRHLNANQLSIELGMDYKSISHNLDVLKKNNLVCKSDARYGGIYFITPLLEANVEVFDEILSILPKKMLVRCADCNCLPAECETSRSPKECPRCSRKYCCCWNLIARNSD